MSAPETPAPPAPLDSAQFRQLADLSLDILTISGIEGRFLWVNAAAERVLGWTVAELTAKPYFEFLHPDDVQPTMEGLGGVLHGATVLDFENRYQHKDGSYRRLSWRCGPVSPDGLLVASARDVTAYREREESTGQHWSQELAERDAQLRAAEREGQFGTWTWNPATNAVWWSRSLYRLLGLDEGEPASFDRFFELVHPDDHERVASNAAAGAEAGELAPQRYRMIRASDGSVREIHAPAGNAVLDDDGNIATMAGALMDVTDQVAAEDALLRSEWILREAQQVAGIGSWTFDPGDGRVTWSDEMYRICGLPPGRPAAMVLHLDLVHPDDRPAVKAAGLATPDTDLPGIEYRLQRLDDGELRHVSTATRVLRDDDGEPILVVGTTRDVTEQRRLENELRHAQKMEAVGQLAGGVAHDFNNSLTAILGNAELARMALADGADATHSLDAVIHAAEQAADVTRQLLAFARRQMVQPAVLDPAERLLVIQRLLSPMLGEQITVDVHAEPDGARIRMDPGQFEQLLMNFAVNARDAMPDGGVLGIACSRVTLGAGHAVRSEGVPPGEYVLLAVSDTGVGMDARTRERIFEPFYTTKESGRGTGLGLATCHGIVAQNRGHILVVSELGEGTTFRIFLPHVADAADPDAAHVGVTTLKAATGTEHILLVEDEASVRAMGVAALRRLGYIVFEAANGHDAIAAARDRGPFDLLLSDVVLPDMRGPAVAEGVHQHQPGCPVLYVSGYTEDAIGQDGEIAADVNFLAKPYTPAVLARTVRELLDQRTR
jgi:two-component system cell cycle sensor histidine kinase/response regulator CckA